MRLAGIVIFFFVTILHCSLSRPGNNPTCGDVNFDSLDKVCDDCYNLYRDIDVYSACQMVNLLFLVSLNKNY